jgi:hypothetical protein
VRWIRSASDFNGNKKLLEEIGQSLAVDNLARELLEDHKM